MIAMTILDTDILVAALRGDNVAKTKLLNLKYSGQSFATTSITAFELIEGAHEHFNSKQKLEEVERLLHSLEILSFDHTASEIAAKIFFDLKKTGRLIDLPDIMIAAIAISNGELLISRNIKDFERIDDLRIEKW